MSKWSLGIALISFLAVACTSSKRAAPGTANTGPKSPTEVNPGQASSVPPPHRLHTVEGISEYRLANGMTVLLFPDESQAKLTVNVTYFVGSRHEGYGEAGMAHLLEHMLFKGTPTRTNIWKDLEDRGARFNGTTSYDRTNYYETFPASEDNLRWALELEADRMVNSLIASEELAKEFSVVRNEFEAGENDPLRVLVDRVASAAFLWHNYGKSVIGNRSDIEKVPVGALQAFYKKYYQPDNAMVVIAGRFDTAKALEMTNATFGAIAKPSRTLAAPYTREPVQDGERDVTLRRVGGVASFLAGYHTVSGSHPDYTAVLAAVHILTNQPSGRLFNKLVTTKLATRVNSINYPLADPGYVMFSAELPPGKTPKTIESAMLSTIENLGSSAITEDELKRFKAEALSDFELTFSDSQRVAILLSNYAAMGDWRLAFLGRDRFDKLTAADVARVAKSYFLRSNRTTGRFLPSEDPTRAPDVEKPLVADLVDGYEGRGAIAQGERFDPSIANIEKRTTRLKLSSGMQLALLPKKTRGNTVVALMTVRYGSERDLRGKAAAVAMLPKMLHRGTKSRSFQQITDRLAELKSSLSIAGGGGAGNTSPSLSISIKSTNENLPKVMRLLAEMLREPSFPASEFNLIRSKDLAKLESGKSNPQVLGQIEVFRAITSFPKNDIRYVPTIDERIAAVKKLKPTDVKALHQNLLGIDNAQLSIVGDFDSATIRAVVAKEFSDWKSKRKYVRISTKFQPTKPKALEVNTPDKKMAMVIIGKTLEIRDDDPDYPALRLASFILGGSPSSRLMTRLRHKGGLSYGAIGRIQANSIDRRGLIFAGAICAPENADKAMAAMKDELAKYSASGVSEKEFEKAVAAYVEFQKTALTRDGGIANGLNRDLFLGRTFEFEQQQLDAIKKLTTAELNAAIKKFVTTEGTVSVLAGDLAKR